MTASPRRPIGLALAALAIGLLAWRGLRERADAPPPAADELSDAAPGHAEPEEDFEELLAADPRLGRYLGPSARSGPFEGDTSDVVGLLVLRLERSSSPEPLAQAKHELARMGAAAVPALRRFIEERFGRMEATPALQNAYEALHQMDVDVPGVRQLLGDALLHPETLVRSVAIRALTKHAAIYEYDALLDLCTRASPDVQRAIVAALHTASPERLEQDLADVLLQPGLEAAWLAGATLIGPCSAAAAARYETLAREAPPGVLPYYAACRALHGDREALERLRELLVSENPTERSITAGALANEGLAGELAPLLEDPDPGLRIFAIDRLASGAAEPTNELRAAIAARLGDGSPDVRRSALAALVGWGDPSATETALDWLTRSRTEFATALVALERRFPDDPELARQALAILIALRDERGHRPSGELARLENGIARIPLPAASRYLLELGRAYPGRTSGARSELRNHRHFALKAGYAGRDVLREAWAVETDPLRRMDLAEALPLGTTEAERASTREFLIGILRSDRVHPYEQLLAAMRLAELGPVAEVAPVLKRATLDVSHPEVRRGLQALLWDWYGR